MNAHKPFKPFQIRWAERMGDQENPYLIRWMFICFNYSIRIHKWIKSDDTRFFHDHTSNFISIVIKGCYTNMTPNGAFKVQAPSIWKAIATDRHYLSIPKEGAWTILLCGRPYHKWGFWTKANQKLSPMRYFYKFGGCAVNRIPINERIKKS